MRISDWSSDVCSSDLDASPGGHLRRRAAGGLLREFLEPFFDLLDDGPRDVCADHAAAVVTGISEIATHVLVEREIGRMHRRKILPRPARMMSTALEGHAIGAVMNSREQVLRSRITALRRRHSRPLLVDGSDWWRAPRVTPQIEKDATGLLSSESRIATAA